MGYMYECGASIDTQYARSLILFHCRITGTEAGQDVKVGLRNYGAEKLNCRISTES